MSEDCPHPYRSNGSWVVPETCELGIVITSTGGTQYRVRCTICGDDRNNAVLPARLVKTLVAQGRQLTWRRVNPPAERTTRCIHRTCDQFAEEWHHFAPRNTFGWDADDWPVEPLCRAHHREWHDRMDGYQTNRKRLAS